MRFLLKPMLAKSPKGALGIHRLGDPPQGSHMVIGLHDSQCLPVCSLRWREQAVDRVIGVCSPYLITSVSFEHFAQGLCGGLPSLCPPRQHDICSVTVSPYLKLEINALSQTSCSNNLKLRTFSLRLQKTTNTL